MGPGTHRFSYHWVQLQSYEFSTLFFMTNLQYHCILGLVEIETLHRRAKTMSKDAGCAGKKITALKIG